MKRLYDLSHEINEDTFHPCGFPSFENLQMFTSHGCRHARVTMSLHTGTHIDAPWHMVRNGKQLQDFGIEELAGEAVVIDLSELYGPSTANGKGISATAIDAALSRLNMKLEKGEALVIYTGWAELYATDPTRYYRQYCTLNQESCQWLVDKGVRLVCLDAPDVDLPSAYLPVPYEAVNHRLLLGNGVLVVENVGGAIREIVNRKVFLIPAPMKISGEYASGAPVRLLAMD